ncbi:MAG TPA: anthranilate phosphoribosyltransferase [Nitrosomonas sp.]|nr:anthranilate phosphoribosyltransferase [Nitrosomonas sp.]HNC42426.1 anthranilate phosphoribosyltransferase [Nitrosomonas sp.]HND36688.1 anthranilate phosphoribosyltransferase [Nitrosomonas sp.]HNH69087.1 anthranilate phosphoribosyltransferase [Nitrosomonas sp.]HNJ38352.1 anthranilate phosphoribosyltransferase [Nitrosomonas sp.]
MSPQEILTRIIQHQDIPHDDMLVLMRQIMQGELSPVLIAAIITGLRVKRESIDEIAAAAQVMREFATSVEVLDTDHLIDTCGTGGDTSHTFNVSTASVFVAAAAGANVAKHGGRSVSSKSGSADVLEALGVGLNQTPQQIAQSIADIGVGFMFAPNFHSAMKHAAPVRRELGVRTLFNILGPLTNPAGAKNQLLGVFDAKLVNLLVSVLHRLGSRHVMVVHGFDGLDEITITGKTLIGELKQGERLEYTIQPEDFGMRSAPIEAIRVSDLNQAKDMLLAVLENEPGPARDIVSLNAGAAIYISGIAPSLSQGIAVAQETLASGAAKAKLQALVNYSRREAH